MNEWRRWCSLSGIEPVPTSPAMVAQFVGTIAPLGIAKVWLLVQEISRAHHLKGFADPTSSPVVTKAVSQLSQIKPPKSWPIDKQFRFSELPYDWQQFLAAQDKSRERVVKMAMQEAHEARLNAGMPKLKKGYYREKSTSEAAA